MRRLLIVDDNAVNRKLATAMLKGRGWAIDEAECGADALMMLRDCAYDYVLLDISMPHLDGLEVCRRIRNSESLRHLHIVAYTAHAMASETATIMAAGFNDIAIKPVTRESLNSKFPD